MAHEFICHSERELANMREICEECAKEYRIVNESDYSGVQFKIQWNE